MFKEEQSPVAEFRGYRVRTFRQLRANLVERTLQGRILHFVPWKGVVGVFIPAQEYPADAAALEEAWAAAGSPSVHLPGPGEALLFGRVLPVRTMPFAGYDDLVEEPDALCVACKRARPSPTKSPTSPTSTTLPPSGAPFPLSSPTGSPALSSTTCDCGSLEVWRLGGLIWSHAARHP